MASSHWAKIKALTGLAPSEGRGETLVPGLFQPPEAPHPGLSTTFTARRSGSSPLPLATSTTLLSSVPFFRFQGPRGYLGDTKYSGTSSRVQGQLISSPSCPVPQGTASSQAPGTRT